MLTGVWWTYPCRGVRIVAEKHKWWGAWRVRSNGGAPIQAEEHQWVLRTAYHSAEGLRWRVKMPRMTDWSDYPDGEAAIG